MIDSFIYTICRKTQCGLARCIFRPLDILYHRIGYRLHDIIQLTLFERVPIIIFIAIPPDQQVQTQTFVLIVVDVVIYFIAINDIEIGILEIAVFHLTFLHEIGGTIVMALHLVEMTLFIEGSHPVFVPLAFPFQAKCHQRHLVLAAGSEIHHYLFRQIVVGEETLVFFPCRVAEGDDALCLLEVHIAIAIGVVVRTRVVELKGMVELEVVAPLTILFVRDPAVAGIDGSRCTYQCKEKSR